MSRNFICYNGDFFFEDEKILGVKNRAYAYGDALFETIHCLGTGAQNLDKHWERLSQGMHLLKMQGGDRLTRERMEHYIGKLLNKNRIFKGARIRMLVFRDPGGLYTPAVNTVSWTMESTALEQEHYSLNTKGLVAEIYDGIHKPVNPLSGFKTSNALIYVLAGIFRKENQLDDCFILNQYGRIAETNSSNLFIYLDDKVITPPLTEGCVAGTMRAAVLEIARQNGYNVEEKGILEKNILDAEEVFITNAIQGIQWIGAYKDKRYFNFVSRKLIALLNQQLFVKA
ncbi:MAG: aminotransferase class IV [Bacteroidales bacterium]|nr:aminotransferase class IV [Bacteroidales bacterium]